MALTRTTLSGGMTAADTEVVLASVTGVVPGTQIVVDQETMRALTTPASATVPVVVVRGIRGSAAVAHPASAGAVFGPPVDFAPPSRVGATAKNEIVSYSATGTIAAPRPGTNRIAILNGTSALTMAVDPPTKENDGDLLIIVGNGKAAHVVDVVTTVGIGDAGATVDKLTFAATAQNCVVFIAANEKWCAFGSTYPAAVTPILLTVA
jgi:hypothetical protein